MLIEKRKLIETFMSLVTIDSESGYEQEISEFVVERLKSLGLKVKIDNANEFFNGETGNVIATLPANKKGSKDKYFNEPLILNAHLDTVCPGLNVRPRMRDGIITSSGETILGGDDKAGVAIILQVLEAIKEHDLPHPPIEVVFTVSEEDCLLGSLYLDYSLLKAKKAISLDGGKLGSLIISAPYKSQIDAEIHGKSAHAKSPQKGINAIQVAAYAVNKMKLGKVDEETTANIGTFTAESPINIIPDNVFLQIEVRSRSLEKLEAHIDHLNRKLSEACASFVCRLETGEELRPILSASTRHDYDGFTIDADDPFVCELKEATEFLDVDALIIDGLGGSDANHFMKKKIKTVIMGVGMKNAHTIEESIATYDLAKAARILLKMVTQR